MNQTLIIILRILHIGAGVFWAGAVFFLARFLGPAAGKLGPAAAPVMRELVEARRIHVALAVAAVVTVLAGALLYWNNIVASHGAWARSVSGQVYGIGAVCGVVALLIGATVNSPTATRIVALGASMQGGAPPSAEAQGEMQRLQRRLAGASAVVATLLLVTVIAMAIARYL